MEQEESNFVCSKMKIGLCNAEITSTVKNASIFNEIYLLKMKLLRILSQEANVKNCLHGHLTETIPSVSVCFLHHFTLLCPFELGFDSSFFR